MVRLDQDRNYPEFPIYHFINEDCFDSNPQAGWLAGWLAGWAGPNQSDLFAWAGAGATPPPEFHPGGCDLNIRVVARPGPGPATPQSTPGPGEFSDLSKND